ncbi:hypothetical protein [Clostridium sp. CCUG 7971]|uniref:hypothetical protein n=1 Tax=Clostridium sp. CCUG 7971 TaxID=2811414 RepID=UPI001ABB3C4F|nr:hypothetical protein [Clostridium sp. CCUG 7971]MBO3445622.1 hypothetical protein [Clostridium sp. CCUG 7971]
MKFKIMFLIGFILFILGIYFSSRSNIMIAVGISGGCIMGCASSLIGFSLVKDSKNKKVRYK